MGPTALVPVVLIYTLCLGILSLMNQQCDLEGQIPEAPSPPVIDVNDWPKAFELICKHLDQHRGLNGKRLLYFVRPHLKVSPSGDNPSSEYATLDPEMIARGLILLRS